MTADPGRQALAAAFNRAVDRDRAAEDAARVDRETRRTGLLARYGTAANALYPCRRENDLSHGLWRLIVPGSLETGQSLMGWRGAPGEVLPPVVRQAVSTAIPAPATAEAAWAEHHYWAERAEVHALFDGPGLPLWVRARRAFLETRLDTLFSMLPADPAAREAWHRQAEGVLPPMAIAEQPPASSPPAAAAQEAETAVPPPPAPLDSAPIADASPSDGAPAAATDPGNPPVEEAATGSDGEPPVDQPARSPEPGTGAEAETETVQSGQPARTREEARAAVRALLGEPLTDREIARRVGVSPSTVAAVRRAALSE